MNDSIWRERRAAMRPWLLLTAIALLAAALRFWRLDGSSLWSDEGNTWALIQRSFAAIARDAAADIHPPGYYWLLKVWTSVFGLDAAGMRSFSALAGVALVLAVYGIGRQTGGPRFALTAAYVAAINPFQIYYAQEARMYMLLALLGAGLIAALLAWLACEERQRAPGWAAAGFVACGAAGFWTHYSFPILLTAAGLAYLWYWLRRSRAHPRGLARLTYFTLANAAILVLYSPWLTTAVERVLNWPKGGVATQVGEGVRLTLRTLTFGPLRDLPEPLWPWLAAAGVLPVLGAAALARRPQGVAVALWLAAPVGLMAGLGLFSDAFLKFLLVAAPAWVLLSVAAARLLPRPDLGYLAVSAGATALAAVSLPAYYTSPTVRDNYAGVAAYVAAVAEPAAAAVVLDAPGQADVWSYYDPGLPVLALPQQRPPDEAATLAALSETVDDRRQVFALYWATDEADPNRIVESWLDRHAFRGLESWQGNVRFVVYSAPNRLACAELTPPVGFGPVLALMGQCQPDLPQMVPSGQTALVGLRWQATQSLSVRYKVTVQLLDAAGQVMAQHDAEPAGGSRPTDGWLPGATVDDNHGLPIPPGAPPGDYRLSVAVYDPVTGARLPTTAGDALELGVVTVTRPAKPVPAEVVPIRRRSNAQFGPVRLVGYDAHKKGYSHAPETPLTPGDQVHVTLLWQAPMPLPATWPADAAFTLRLGDQVLNAPLAGTAFPTAAWQPGDLARGEFDLLFDGRGVVPTLQVGKTVLRLARLPR